jgi:hypothetical protein
MTEQHINIHNLAPGQKEGDAHPENPYSEHKYPTFFRLYNRGDQEAKTPLDLDTDEYFVKNYDKFEQMVKADTSSSKFEQTQGLITSTQTDSIDFEKYHEQHPDKYNVLSEAKYDSATLAFLSRVIHGARDVANRLGLRPLSKQDQERMSQIQADYQRAVADKNTDLQQKLWSEFDTLKRRGATPEVYQQYQSEVAKIASTLSPAYANKVELSITPEVFRTISGHGDVREGGWYDADFFPESSRRHWVKNGLVVQMPKTQLANFHTNMIFGSEVGKKLDGAYHKSMQAMLDFKRKKIGAKFALGVYGGLVLWTIWFKWIQINQREYFRQKSKFAIRLMNDEDLLTPQQQAILNKHNAWASKYYEEDEEEEAGGEEEEAEDE